MPLRLSEAPRDATASNADHSATDGIDTPVCGRVV
jgi:hypothetical protein